MVSGVLLWVYPKFQSPLRCYLSLSLSWQPLSPCDPLSMTRSLDAALSLVCSPSPSGGHHSPPVSSSRRRSNLVACRQWKESRGDKEVTSKPAAKACWLVCMPTLARCLHQWLRHHLCTMATQDLHLRFRDREVVNIHRSKFCFIKFGCFENLPSFFLSTLQRSFKQFHHFSDNHCLGWTKTFMMDELYVLMLLLSIPTWFGGYWLEFLYCCSGNFLFC